MVQMIQRSFTSGEIAPSLRSRADMVKYATGLALCQNMFIRAQGGAYSRPPFRYIGEVLDSSFKARLIPFSFNTSQTYVLEFQHLTMRVIKNGGYVLDGAGPALFELVTPYAETDLFRLGYTQDADVLTIVHPDHDPADLVRLADDNWTLTAIDYSSAITPPTLAGSDVYVITGVTQANPAVVTMIAPINLVTGMTIVIAAVVGMTTINNRSFRVTQLTGTTFELDNEDSTAYAAYVSGGTATLSLSATTIGSGAGTYEKTYEYVVTAVVNDVESLSSSPVTIFTNSLSVTAGIRLEWAAVTDAEYYRIYKSPSVNTLTYGWIGDSNTLQFDDYNIAPITSDSPPINRTPFAGTDNKPSAVNYYQQRQIFANTNNEPQTVFTTQTANYDSLRLSNPTRDDDSITFTIAARQVNEIRHIVSLDSMILLTSGGEWIISEGRDQVLTPSTVGARIQSYNGSSWVAPVVINSTAVYVQEKGARIRDLQYDFSTDKYTGNDLSLMSEHFFEDHTIVDMAYAAEPYSILWCVRDDGVLLGLTYQREHQVYAWHQHITDGFFESIAVISEGGRDVLYAVIRREINSSFVRYVERLEARTISNNEAFSLDSSLSYNGLPVTVITGLDHLEGKTVSIVADSNVMNDQVVTGGEITLIQESSIVHVGLAYIPVIELLDIDMASSVETFKAQSKSVNRVIIEVEGSRGGWVGSSGDFQTEPDMVEIKPRFDSDSYDTIQFKTYKQEVFIQPTWNQGGGVRIEQRSPLPFAVLSVIPRFDVSD